MDLCFYQNKKSRLNSEFSMEHVPLEEYKLQICSAPSFGIWNLFFGA